MVSTQVDVLDGLSSSTAIKGPCVVATTGNITLAGEQNVGGVDVVENDRVLVRAQTDPSENGIWAVSTGDWRRTKDFSRNDDVVVGTLVMVVADRALYVLSFTGTLSIGTTHLAFTLREQEGRPVNLLDYGANGTGTVDDSLAIQAALLGGDAHLYIPAGVYRCDGYIRLYENTTIEMHPDAVIEHNASTGPLFMNGEYGNAAFSSAYDGPGNITIRGGTIDLALSSASLVLNVAIALAHAENINIENVTFLNAYQGHQIELNAIRHGIVRNCVFDGMTLTSPGSREFINVDYSYSGGFPHFGSYDGTVCDDVLIEANSFKNGDVSVGSHAIGATLHSNIRVINNRVENMTTSGIAPRYWDKSTVSGNELIDCGARGIVGWELKRTLISGNRITGECSSQGITIDSGTVICTDVIVRDNVLENITGNGITVYDAERVQVLSNTLRSINGIGVHEDGGLHCIFRGNTILGANQGNTGASGMALQGTGHVARDNRIDATGFTYNHDYAVEIGSSAVDVSLFTKGMVAGSSGVVNQNAASTRTKINGAFRVSIGDDAAKTFPLDMLNSQGLVRIACESNVSPSPRGIWWVRGNSAVVTELTKVTDANVATTTGALTGTTGTDGRVTISAHTDLNLYIENRSGGAKWFAVDDMGGSQ